MCRQIDFEYRNVNDTPQQDEPHTATFPFSIVIVMDTELQMIIEYLDLKSLRNLTRQIIVRKQNPLV
jgi:hypothetical protein